MADKNDKNDKQGIKEGREPQRLGASRLFGSLRDVLAAAGRDVGEGTVTVARSDGLPTASTAALPAPVQPMKVVGGMPADGENRQSPNPQPHSPQGHSQSIAEKEKVMKQPHEPKLADVSRIAPRSDQTMLKQAPSPKVSDAEVVPPTRPAVRNSAGKSASMGTGDGRTQLIRGRNKVTRSKFHQDPVVGWLVIVGGPGLGAYRPIFEGNNTIGRTPSQRIPIDFGDDTISGEEQAYVRYDSTDRKFLFVPNLAKTNVVQINDKKPTGAVELVAMDVITMGRTQLVFVPFCGPEFDWAELSELKE